MQPKDIARELLPLLGGIQNIDKVAHCTTRLRLVLREEGKADVAAIEKLDFVEGVYNRTGQIQIVFGTGIVNKIYRALLELTRPPEAETIAAEAEAAEPIPVNRTSINPVIRLAMLLSNIFVPIIPVIVASGLLNGVNGTIKAFHWVPADNAIITLVGILSSSAFIFLPILVGFHAAKELGGNPFIGAVIGGILTHPVLLNPMADGTKIPETVDFFRLQITLIGYQGTVIPVIISVYLMSLIEKGLRKAVPRSFELLVVPFFTIVLTGLISLLAIGPTVMFIGGFLTSGLDYTLKHAGLITGLLFGGSYSLIVITGLHHSFHALEATLLADPQIGVNFLLPIWSVANIAQGGAGLAVYFRTRNARLKEIAFPAALSAFLGIIEPVVFGINLKLVRPFIGALIGGALGGAYVAQAHVLTNAYGLTGIPMLAIAAPFGRANILHYLIGLAISVVSAFVSTWLMLTRDIHIRKRRSSS